MTAIFIRREAEELTFQAWMKSEPHDNRRVRLVIGHSGSGKSALLRRFEQMAVDHQPERWFVQLIELNGSESASAFLERVLNDTHWLLKGRFLSRGPRDRRFVQALLKAIPTAGSLLAELVDKDTRPGWARFITYCEAVSDSLAKTNDRLLLLVDPDREMNSDQSEDWLSVSKRLPSHIRIVVAQRPTDTLAAAPEARLTFCFTPAEGALADLDQNSVRDWYRREMAEGRLSDAAGKWGAAARETLADTMFEKVSGLPYGHEAAIRLLAATRPDSPFECVGSSIRSVADLVEVQFQSLARLGADKLRAALALQTFTVPVRPEIWAKAASMESEELTAALSNRRFSAVFRTEPGERFAPFHLLFGERLEKELQRNPELSAELADTAWRTLEALLKTQSPDRLLADPLDLVAATIVAAKSRDLTRLTDALGLVADAKVRLNMWESYEADVRLVLSRAGQDALILARYSNALGGIHKHRGESEQAEACYLNALSIGGSDVQLPAGLSVKSLETIQTLRREAREACRNMEQLYRSLDRNDEAAQMALRALTYSGGPQPMPDAIRSFGEQGIALATAGDLKGAEMAFRNARAAAKQFGGADHFETSCLNLGVVYTMQNRSDDARRVFTEGLGSAQSRRAKENEARFLEQLGCLDRDSGDIVAARRNWENAIAIHRDRNEARETKRLEKLLASITS
jgi:tetratricopeptide (TPR) repeat protein